jgi:hypothetical protein
MVMATMVIDDDSRKPWPTRNGKFVSGIGLKYVTFAGVKFLSRWPPFMIQYEFILCEDGSKSKVLGRRTSEALNQLCVWQMDVRLGKRPTPARSMY